MITKLSIRAFKGLREFAIAPKRVNLLVGANGTGKSNFADLIAFISKLSSRGLAPAMDELGGLSQVRTRQPGAGTPYKFHLEFEIGEDISRGIQNARYEFTLAQSKEIKVQSEALEATLYKRKPGKPAKQGFPNFDTGTPVKIAYRREGSVIKEWSEKN